MPIKFIFCLLWLSLSLNAQELSVQQKAWLYRITQRTACLNRNWSRYFVYNKPVMQEEAEGATIQERGYGFHISSWDSLEQSIIQNPALLQVDWEAISQSSPGLVSNAAVKLALWELYVELKNGYQESPPFSMSEDVNVIYREMIEAMPRKMKKGAVLKEKYMPVFYDVINPSLGFRRKLASLESVSMLTAEEKKDCF